MGAGTGPARHRAVGDYGERVAARHLQERGLIVVDRNWRCDQGEIDIVAVREDPPALVVCEVKTRTSEHFGSPVEQVTARKLARLRRLAVAWLRDHPDLPDHPGHPELARIPVQVDLVGVVVPRSGAPVVDHHEGVLA